jgi:hypothetical protein
LAFSATAEPEISDRNRSPTWITTSAFPGTYYEEMYHLILKMYNWTTVLIVTDETEMSFYFYVSNRVSRFLKNGPNSQVEKMSYSLKDATFSPKKITNRLTSSSRGMYDSSIRLFVDIKGIVFAYLSFFPVMIFFGYEPQLREILVNIFEVSGLLRMKTANDILVITFSSSKLRTKE